MRPQTKYFLHAGLVNSLRLYNKQGVLKPYTDSMDYVQENMKCCGINGPSDYNDYHNATFWNNEGKTAVCPTYGYVNTVPLWTKVSTWGTILQVWTTLSREERISFPPHPLPGSLLHHYWHVSHPCFLWQNRGSDQVHRLR